MNLCPYGYKIVIILVFRISYLDCFNLILNKKYSKEDSSYGLFWYLVLPNYLLAFKNLLPNCLFEYI